MGNVASSRPHVLGQAAVAGTKVLEEKLIPADAVSRLADPERLKGDANEGSDNFQANVLRDITSLAVCWALTLTTSTLLTTIGPLSADTLGAESTLSPFTIGVFLIGAAVSSVPSGWLFRTYGRSGGFQLGCLFQICGSIVGVIAMYASVLSLVFISCFLVGCGQGIGQFYRFSAVEISPPHFKEQAISYVLSGGVLAAVLGPVSASYSDTMVSEQYTGSFIIMAAIGLLNMGVLSLITFPPIHTHNQNQPNSAAVGRSLRSIVSTPEFILSCTIATVAHTVMTMVMSNCTIAMNERRFSFSDQSWVMMGHFLAMFSPGFFTGKMIASHGGFLVSVVGSIIFALSSVVFVIGQEYWNFMLGMILLGVGWNLAFSSGTAMLTSCYSKDEATDVQAVNDFILFSVAGCGSLVSGAIYSSLGWFKLIYIISSLMFINLIFFVVANHWKASKKTVATEADVLDALLDGDENDELLRRLSVRSLSVV